MLRDVRRDDHGKIEMDQLDELAVGLYLSGVDIMGISRFTQTRHTGI